jgi:hypothetical protein
LFLKNPLFLHKQWGANVMLLAEITPFEPDPGNTGEGKRVASYLIVIV